MRELEAGLWHWMAPHPEWTPEDGGPEGWPQEVSSYAVEAGSRLVLIDPIAPPSLLGELVSAREPVVVLTCAWHDRDSRVVVERFGATVYAPPREEGKEQVSGPVFHAGDRLPGGIVAYGAIEPNDLVLWIAERRALVFGDTLIDRGQGSRSP